MGHPRWTEDFKIDAVKQITARGYSVADVSQRLGVSTHSLYARVKRYSSPPGVTVKDDQSAETRRLKQVLARVTQSVTSKKTNRVLRKGCQVRYAFIKVHRVRFTSLDRASFLRQHNLERSMSHRGNCHDNAVVQRFFSLLKRERIRRRTYCIRAEVKQDVFDYIENVLQSKTQARQQRDAVARQLRTMPETKPAGCLENAGLSRFAFEGRKIKLVA